MKNEFAFNYNYIVWLYLESTMAIFGTENIINLLNVSQLVVQSNLTKTSLS